MSNQAFLTVTEAAELLRVKIPTIYKWVQTRQIPYRKHGRLLCFDRQSLIDWSNTTKIQPYFDKP
jgi:excisionase family DNA binding protein